MSVCLPVTYASQSFLDDIDRIAVPDYEPTDEDIVRARLRTVGVQEHRFIIDESPSFAPLSDHGKEWIMYDVGGTRSSVRVPYIPSSAARLTCVCSAQHGRPFSTTWTPSYFSPRYRASTNGYAKTGTSTVWRTASSCGAASARPASSPRRRSSSFSTSATSCTRR